MIVLSLDQALKICGYSVYDSSTDKLIDYGCKDFKEIAYNGDIEFTMIRIVEIKEWFKELVVKYKPEIFIIEDTQKQINPNVFKKLSCLMGSLGSYLEEMKYPYFICHCTQWKSFLGIKGKKSVDQKANAKQYIKDRFYIDVQQDTVDAICIGLWGANEIKKHI